MALPRVAQSAMWVGASLGGNFIAPTKVKASGPTDTDNDDGDSGSQTSDTIRMNASVIGGVTLGYDFVNTGFGAYAWPDWMKYFSIATDLTYNRLVLKTKGSGDDSDLPEGSRLNGYFIAWTFLFMAHYGFLPDSEVPSGRINPYIGVGPAIVFSGINLKSDESDEVEEGEVTTKGKAGGHAVNVALVVEPGIRWMVLRNVSIDTAFRYRYCQPSWNVGEGTTIKANLNQFAFLVRANLHF